MRALILGLALTNAGSEDPLLRILEALASLEKAVAEDFRSRGQSITDLVRRRFWRIIVVKKL